MLKSYEIILCQHPLIKENQNYLNKSSPFKKINIIFLVINRNIIFITKEI